MPECLVPVATWRPRGRRVSMAESQSGTRTFDALEPTEPASDPSQSSTLGSQAPRPIWLGTADPGRQVSRHQHMTVGPRVACYPSRHERRPHSRGEPRAAPPREDDRSRRRTDLVRNARRVYCHRAGSCRRPHVCTPEYRTQTSRRLSPWAVTRPSNAVVSGRPSRPGDRHTAPHSQQEPLPAQQETRPSRQEPRHSQQASLLGS